MSTPFHFLYIDKFFEPACGEWVADPNLCTPYLAQEKPFLASFEKEVNSASPPAAAGA